MGGHPPFGYRPHARTLVVEEPEARIVRWIFKLYLKLGTVDYFQKGAPDFTAKLRPLRSSISSSSK